MAVDPRPVMPPAPAPPSLRLPALRWLVGLPLALLLLVVVAGAALLYSQAGSAWLLRLVPGLSVTAPRGALLGDRFGADALRWEGAAGRLEIDAPSLEALQWHWLPTAGSWIGLRAGRLHADAVRWHSGPASAEPAPTLPRHLRLPVQLELPLSVDRLQIDDQPPLLALALNLQLGADGGRHHAVEALSLRWDQLVLHGRLQVATDAPLALDGLLRFEGLADAPLHWRAALRVSGSLGRAELVAGLEGAAAADQPPALLTLRAAVEPFARWPLAELGAETEALDLALLSSRLPRTRLDGQIRLRGRALDQPIAAELSLRNRLPGRWDEGRLPLRQAELALEATPTEAGRLRVSRFELQLGNAGEAAGRWTGEGLWEGHELRLDTRIDALRPQWLDGRASPMTLDGSLSLELTQLPSPDPAASAPTGTPRAALVTQLRGRVEAAAPTIELDLALNASQGRLEIERLTAGAAGAQADLKALAQLEGGRWSLSSQGRLVEFDPLPWWPGARDPRWRRGAHQLNADWTLALQLPPAAESMAPQDLLLRLTGEGRFGLQRSRLAGVPLQASVTIAQEPTGPQARQRGTRVLASVDVDGNVVKLDGQALPLVDGSQDRWSVDIDAPRLAALAPIVALFPASTAWAPRQGLVRARAEATGRWPELRTQGEAELIGLRAGTVGLERGRLRWQAATAADAPLALELELEQLALAGQPVPLLGASAKGSWRAHELRVDVAVPLQPQPDLAKALQLPTARGTRIALRGQGAWAPRVDGSRWEGRLRRLAVGAWDGRTSAADEAVAADWFDARDLRAELDFGPNGQLQRLQAQAGRAALPSGVQLSWDEIRYDALAAQPLLQLQARIEAFAVAPMLARWQPAMGWAGDLRVGATVALRAGEQFDADIVIEREDGDLQVLDGTDQTLQLGLSDLRLALGAHDGQWIVTSALAGRTLGELGGFARVMARPQDRWPAADAPLDGTLALRVGDLGIWGAWVPPGWRLAGSIETTGVLAGRFGAPQLTGALHGRDLAVRNLLQGVHVTDGQVDLRLDGETATVERFTLRGGDGLLRLSGGARLGAAPQASLRVEAERFQLLGRIDRRLVTSGQAELRLDPETIDLKGRFGVDRGLIDLSRADAPSLDADVVVRRADAAPEEEAAPSRAEVRREVRVALELDLGESLVVRGRGLDTRLAGLLKISAPAGKLAVRGVVRTVGGTYAAYGQRMEIARGIVSFSGPIESPQIDVLALRPKLDVEVGVAITGSVQAPRVRLHSNPEMGETDKLSWLVLGRAPDALGRTDTALLQRAAIALLSGEEAGPTDALVRNLGLDELSVRQSGNGDVQETVVSLGKQISDRWYVGYERSINATAGTWQLIYRVAQRFTLRAQSGVEDTLDLIWVWRRP